MRRLVYSPKAYVYIQTAPPNPQVFNISDLVVSGNVHRKVNQISTAEVVFQNPNRMFTQPGNPTFRPMDKITIFLQRLAGFPVQVFTGYLDATPYYQMYPGTCTLSASCTLKRLQYTYFDPGLPFVVEFLARYGWISDGNGTISNPVQSNGPSTDTILGGSLSQNSQNQQQFAQSASMSDLMFASLKHIAGWDPNLILIESLPQNLTDRIHLIYNSLTEGADQAEANFNLWLKDYIGAGSSGNGGSGTSLNGVSLDSLSSEQSHVLDVLLSVADSMNVSDKLRLAAIETGLVESNLKELHGGDADSQNWRQERASVYGADWARTGGANNTLASARRFYNECKQYDHGQSAGELAADVQRPAAKYRSRYADQEGNAQRLLSEYRAKQGGSASTNSDTGAETQVKSGVPRDPDFTTSTATDSTTSDSKDTTKASTTRLDAIIAEANRLSKLAKSGKMPYGPQRPPVDQNDCSSSVTLLLKAGGYKVDGWPTTGLIEKYLKRGRDPSGRVTFWERIVGGPGGLDGDHIWAMIKGRPFTTHSGQGGAWVDDYYAKDNPEANDFHPWHVSGLDQPHSVPADADLTSGSDSSGDSTGAFDALAAAKGATVYTSMEFPSAVNQAESMLLQGDDARGRSLMNDQPLFPFIEQLAKGTLRNFMSLPNGDFYAFHPDYFGAFGTAPYWSIEDIEVLEGNIQLSDESLITHVFVTGATLPDQNIDISRKLQTHGVVNVLNAGTADFLNVENDAKAEHTKAKKNSSDGRSKGNTTDTDLKPFMGSVDDALRFLNHYGTRPYVEDAPFIRSHIFETFYAYQTFMLAWARQFMTTFQFTFMPEIFPGGLIQFPGHEIQMYVDECHHSFDYSSGFTTTANLSAPSSTSGDNKGISRGMIRSWNNLPEWTGR